jgi:hypothetical protein
MRCTPADRATSAVRKALVHAVADGAVVVQRGEDLLHPCAARRRCRLTLRKVSCWPANDGVGQVLGGGRRAHRERGHPGCRVQLGVGVADGRLEVGREGLCSMTQPRISAPASASARTSSVFSVDSRGDAPVQRRRACRNSRNAWAVVAKPPGTRTAVSANWLIISPRAGVLAADRPRRRSFSVVQTARPGRSLRGVADMGKLLET